MIRKSSLVILSILLTQHAYSSILSTNGVGDLSLFGESYEGVISSPAGNITGFSTATLENTSFLGETNNQTDSSELKNGGDGLLLESIDNTTINNDSISPIKGGDGGSVVYNAPSTFVRLEVNGGLALGINKEVAPTYLGPGSQVFTLQHGEIRGGSGGIITGSLGNISEANGGDGFFAENVNLVFSGGTIIGGNGGIISTDGADIVARGGDGIKTGFDVGLTSISGDATFIGGMGGTIVSENGTLADARGGAGFNFQSLNLGAYPNPRDNTITNTVTAGTFRGGSGGTIVAQDAATADGGNGFYANLHNFVINGGQFEGGNGGSITASGFTQDPSAKGGYGFYSYLNHYLEINAGTFTGGEGGIINSLQQESTAGLGIVDTPALIKGGIFSDNAIFFESQIRNNTLNIESMTLGTVELSSYAGMESSAFIEDVELSTFLLSESGDKLLDLTNVQVNNIIVESGAVELNTFENSSFEAIEIQNGSFDYNTGNFTLSNGGEIELIHENAALNFNGGTSTFEAGSTLDVGLGTVSGTAIVMASNSVTKIGVSANGASSTPTKGTLTASSSINFEEGAIVQLVNDGTYTKWDELEGTDGIIIANASSITALNTNQVSIVGDKPWLTGVIGLNFDSVSDNLYAEIGLLDLGAALNATGELATMADKLQPLIDGSAEISALFRDGFPTQQAAISGITDSFFRAPEVANSLIGLQSVVRDQVAGRTRGYLKANRFGTSAPRGPRGPDAGWWDRSMERINESLPKADMRRGLDALNESLPKIELSFDRQEDQQQSYYKRFINWLNEKAPSFKSSAPTFTSDYKSWGKAYYSDLAQDAVDDFAGYEAQVIGGIAGMDRKLDHGVLGWAAGYADTTILGNFEQNADVDTLHGTIYYTAATQRAYLDASMSYAYSLVETIGPAGAGGYTADYNASNLSFALGAGVGFTAFNDRVQVTPEFLFLSTLYDQEAYTETSAVTGMPDKQFSAYDDWSHKVELGATFSLLQILESTSMNLAIQPELRLHWLRELNPNLADQSYLFVDEQFSAALQAREENLLRTGLGIRFWDWADHRTEFSFDLDAITGSDYEEFTVSGSFIHRF